MTNETDDLGRRGCGLIEVLSQNLPEGLEKNTKYLRTAGVAAEI
jgi:hypothetical protein